MEHSKRYGIIMIIVAVIFFLLAANGFINLAYGKPPVMQPPANHTGSKLGFYTWTYVHFYLLPFFWAFVGWLLYKCGTEKVKSKAAEEKESPKISE